MNIHRAIGALALLCLAACVTTDGGDPSRTVSTWKGYSVGENIPPLELVAAAKRAKSEGRVTITPLPQSQLAAACRQAVDQGEAGILVACTIVTGPPSHRTYVLYVDRSFPDWVQQLYLTHEEGHVGQIELGRPRDHVGFGDPTVDLIVRLGG